jgi:hypothetical protein
VSKSTSNKPKGRTIDFEPNIIKDTKQQSKGELLPLGQRQMKQAA